MFTRDVHQTTQIAKTAPKSPAKWHNCSAPQVTVHCNTLYPLYILIFFNIKYFIISLINPSFQKKILVDLVSVD